MLEDVEFCLRKGEIHALMGANGAGKSTLIKILSGAHKKDSGTILIDGEEADIQSPVSSKAHGIRSSLWRLIFRWPTTSFSDRRR